MFHRFYPSEIALSSQRLNKLKASFSVEALDALDEQENGYEVELFTESGTLSDLKISVSKELMGDDFLLGFWLFYRKIMVGKPLLELSRPNFREWESYFRDFNHQLSIKEDDFSQGEKLYGVLMSTLVEEIFNHAWKKSEAVRPLGQSQEWIRELEILNQRLERFFNEFSSVHGAFKLLDWASLGEFPSQMSLAIAYSQQISLTHEFILSLKTFLLKVLPETKEIKLVAE